MFKHSLSIILAFVFLIITSSAFAQSSSDGTVIEPSSDPDVAIMSWEPPLTRNNGDVLDPTTELSEYKLYCGDIVTSFPANVEGNSRTVEKSTILSGYGEHRCSITAVDTEGRESYKSEPVTVTWEMSPPSPPRQFIIITGQ